jgi:hypothetical protein
MRRHGANQGSVDGRDLYALFVGDIGGEDIALAADIEGTRRKSLLRAPVNGEHH